MVDFSSTRKSKIALHCPFNGTVSARGLGHGWTRGPPRRRYFHRDVDGVIPNGNRRRRLPFLFYFILFLQFSFHV